MRLLAFLLRKVSEVSKGLIVMIKLFAMLKVGEGDPRAREMGGSEVRALTICRQET